MTTGITPGAEVAQRKNVVTAICPLNATTALSNPIETTTSKGKGSEVSLSLTGSLVEIMTPEQVSDKFEKQAFVIETNSGDNNQFTETVQFELHNKFVGAIERHKVGDVITCHFDVRGRKWEPQGKPPRYFTNLVCWKITAETRSDNSSQEPPATSQEQQDAIPF